LVPLSHTAGKFGLNRILVVVTFTLPPFKRDSADRWPDDVALEVIR